MPLFRPIFVLMIALSKEYALVCKYILTHFNTTGADCLDTSDIALVVDVSESIEGDRKYPGNFNGSSSYSSKPLRGD